jgi:hypothetical protein
MELLLFALLIYFGCAQIHAMESPPHKVVASRESASAIYTPTSIKVRINLLTAIANGIEGDKSDELLDPEQTDPSLLVASPQNFLKRVRGVYSELLAEEFLEHGVTPEMVAKEIPDLKQEIRSEAEKHERLLPLASWPIRSIGLELAQKLGQNLTFRKTPDLLEAYLNDAQVVTNEELLTRTATSPKSVAWVLAHEAGHKIGDDQAERAAYLEASKKVEFTMELEQTRRKKCKSQEVFADLTGPMHSPGLAKAGVRMMRRFIAQEGAGDSYEHPTNFERYDVAVASDAFMEQALKEQKRAVKRSLLQELADSEA